MSWSRALIPIFALVLAVLVTPTTATAAPASPPAAPDALPMALPETSPALDVIDAEAFQEVVDVTERITPYLYIDEEGLVQLAEVTAEELGVTEQFLADYREAMRHSNALIERGEITVAPDMTVSVTERFGPVSRSVSGLDAAVSPGGDVPMAAPSGDVPEWGAWNYGSGAMFYNSYPDWTYYRYRYYGLSNSMAAYLRLPWMSTYLVYFYGYNQYYFNSYCYNPYGTYYFIPYNYCSPGLGYKPAYFWVRMFGGQGPYWGWRGFWCRY